MVRQFEEKDLEQIQQIDNMMWLSLQWNKTYHKEDAFVYIENDEVMGVGALAYEASWYCIEQDSMKKPCKAAFSDGNSGKDMIIGNDISQYTMSINTCIVDTCEEEKQKEIDRELTRKLQMHFAEYQKKYPDKQIALRCWMEDTEKDVMQFYLEEGFGCHNLVWVLGFDLTQDIPTYRCPQNIIIGKHSFEDDGMETYMKANELGFGYPDPEGELRFRLGDPDTVVFTAKDGDEVVSSVTIWNIGNGRYATENIFTIPKYRHQNICRATIAYALQYLKDKGQKLATLTCVGDNLPAIKMYLSMGYFLKYYLVEMHYVVQK